MMLRHHLRGRPLVPRAPDFPSAEVGTGRALVGVHVAAAFPSRGAERFRQRRSRSPWSSSAGYLTYRLDRWADLGAASRDRTRTLTIGGFVTAPHYLFFATIEVVGLPP